ncbi:MAG: NUDIX hydrolase [archaeon]|jgi:8-oxo-dGTP pyrophosphatase MutT (NUDIX family)
MNYRQGVSAFILNDKKEFLMVLGLKKVLKELDYWKIPAGGIEISEDQETALKRELFEELGFTENDYTIIGKSSHKDKFNWREELCEGRYQKNGIWYDGKEISIFILKLKNPEIEFRLQETEVLGTKWFNKDNYSKSIFTSSQLEVMKKVIEEFKEYF